MNINADTLEQIFVDCVSFFFYVEYRWRIDETNRWSMRRNQSILMSIQVVIPYFRTHQILFMWSNHPCFFFLGRYWWCRYWWCRCCCYQVSSRMTPCIKNGSNFFFNLHFNDELYHLICQAWSFSLITSKAKKKHQPCISKLMLKP